MKYYEENNIIFNLSYNTRNMCVFDMRKLIIMILLNIQ